MSEKPSVLFVCIHNAGRSQMAAGFLSALAGDAIEVRSAGSAPADAVNPAAVEAMAEVGIDISTQNPKILTTDAGVPSVLRTADQIGSQLERMNWVDEEISEILTGVSGRNGQACGGGAKVHRAGRARTRAQRYHCWKLGAELSSKARDRRAAAGII